MLAPGFYNMDCMEGMKQFPDNYFELAIVDPPYGDGGGGSAERRDSEDDSTGTAGRFPRQNLRRGGHDGRTTSRVDCEKAKVSRTGGKWAAKFGKKS